MMRISAALVTLGLGLWWKNVVGAIIAGIATLYSVQFLLG